MTSTPIRALVTGAGGFLGRFVVRALRKQGREVTVLDLAPVEALPTLVADLAAGPPDLRELHFHEVYHLAGLAHRVPRTKEEARRFYEVNCKGTQHLLEGLAGSALPQGGLLLVSTVAVYGVDEGTGIDEDHPRAAKDPYGRSKRMAEDAVLEWGRTHGIRTAIIRPPLVAGPGVPGNLGAMIQGLQTGKYLRIAGGQARRSVVNADELAAILPAALLQGGIYHLTDGVHPAFRDLEQAMCAQFGRKEPVNLCRPAAFMLGKAMDLAQRLTGKHMPVDSRRLGKMMQTLTFDDTRARRELGWNSTPVVERMGWTMGGEKGGGAQR